MALLKAKIRGQKFIKSPGDSGADSKVISITDLEVVGTGDSNSFVLPELDTANGVQGWNSDSGAKLTADSNFYISSTSDSGTALASGVVVRVAGLVPGTNCIVVGMHKGRDGNLSES